MDHMKVKAKSGRDVSFEELMIMGKYMKHLQKFNSFVDACVKEGEKRLSYGRIKEFEGLVVSGEYKTHLKKHIYDKKKSVDEFFFAFCSQMDGNDFLINVIDALCRSCVRKGRYHPDDLSTVKKLVGTIRPELLRLEILNELENILEDIKPTVETIDASELAKLDEYDSISSFSESSHDDD